VHLRFLLLKPGSRYAFLRAWIEETYQFSEEDQQTLDEGELSPQYNRDEFRKSVMQARLDTAEAALRNMFRIMRSPTKMSVRFYRYQPSLFVVAVNRWVFVETYVWGVDRDYQPDPVAPYLAKRLPVMRFRRGSFSGTIFENHFDRVWRCSQTIRLFPWGGDDGKNQAHQDPSSVKKSF